MNTSTVEIQLPPDLAMLYQEATPDEREKLDGLVEAILRGLLNPTELTFTELLDEMSAEAQKNGLTPQILEQILAEDD